MLQSERVLQARRGRLLCWLQDLGHGWHMTSTKSRCPRIARLQCHNYPDAALTNLTTPAMRPLASATAHDIALTTHWSSSSSSVATIANGPSWAGLATTTGAGTTNIGATSTGVIAAATRKRVMSQTLFRGQKARRAVADNPSNTELFQYRSFQSIFSRKGRR